MHSILEICKVPSTLNFMQYVLIPKWPLTSLSTQLCVIFFFKELKFSLCCPPVLECVAFAWSLGDLPRQHSWRKSTPHLLAAVICQWLFPWGRTSCLPCRSVLGGCLTSACTALVRPSTNTVISYMQLPCCVWKQFPRSYPLSLALTFFVPYFPY